MSTKVLSHDKGILLFSFDTAEFQYSKITKKCIELLRIHCPDIPVVVVGDRIIESADSTILAEDPQPNINNLRGP